jgi:hypothetical protein
MIVPAVENTFVGLKQTVCFDLRGSARAVGKISVQEWLSFLKIDAGIDMTTVEQALQHTITGGIFVTMNTEEQYKVVLGKAEAGVAWSKQGGAMVYGWSAGEEVTSLTLNNVFSNSDMEAIKLELGKCGKIVAEQRQYYKDCPTVKTGIVTVKMRLRPQVVVPTYLFEERVGNTVQVFSDRHSKLCHRCLEHGHLTAFCRKPVKSRQAASKSKTWAMVVSASESASPDVSVSDTSVSVPSPVVIQEKDPQPKVQDTVQSIPEVLSVEVIQPIESTQVTEDQATGHSEPGGNTKEMMVVEQEQEQAQVGKKVEKTKNGKRMARSLSPNSKLKLEEKKTRIMGKVDKSTL